MMVQPAITNPRILIGKHYHRMCEACFKIFRERGLGCINGHYICLLCQRSPRHWAEHPEQQRRVLKREENATLWHNYDREKLSYSEKIARLQRLAHSIRNARHLAAWNRKLNKPDFKEEFTKLTEKNG